jgi:hypothetical protein
MSALVAGSGCDKKGTSAANATPTSGGSDEAFDLDAVEVFLVAGGQPEMVKVTKGKAKDVEVPKDSGIKFKLEDGTVTFWAEKGAKSGDREVTIKGEQKDAKVTAHVKAK